MSMTYVKIMSGENRPDDHHHKAFQVIPVPHGQAIQFEQDPEPHVQIGDLSYPVSGNVYLMNNEGKTISTFTPRKHDPSKCEEPNEDPASGVATHQTIESVRDAIGRVHDLTIIGLENGICYTNNFKDFWFVDTMAVATNHGVVAVNKQIVRYGEMIKFSSLVRKLPRFDVLEDIETCVFVISGETIQRTIHIPDFDHILVLRDDRYDITYNNMEMAKNSEQFRLEPDEYTTTQIDSRLFDLLGDGNYRISLSNNRIKHRINSFNYNGNRSKIMMQMSKITESTV